MSYRKSGSVLILAVSMLATGCTAGHRIKKFDGAEQVSKGDQAVYYALPRTVVVTTFQVKKVETVEGKDSAGGTHCFATLNEPTTWLEVDPSTGASYPFWKVLGFSELPQLGKTFSVKGTPIITTAPEPDPDQIFRVDLTSSAFTKRQLKLSFGSLGVLESGTSSVQDKRLDISLAVFSSLLKWGGAIAGLRESLPEGLSLLKGDSPKTSVPDHCKAAGNRIWEARQSIAALPGRLGKSIDEKEAEWLKDTYSKQIDKEIELFVRRSETTGAIACAVRPTASTEVTQAFENLKLDKSQGFKAAVGAECAIPPEFAGDFPCGEIYSVELERNLDHLSEKLRSAGVDAAHDDKEDQGFYYRVPAIAKAELKLDGKAVTRADVVVAQMGIVAALP